MLASSGAKRVAESGTAGPCSIAPGLEVDLILEYADRTWAAIEVKLGSSRIHEAEKALLTLRNSRVDVNRIGPPAFLAVITGSEYAYTMSSGVHVVPLAALAA